MDVLASIGGEDATLLVVISGFCVSQTEHTCSRPSPSSVALVCTGESVMHVAATIGEDSTLFGEVVISWFCISQTEDNCSGTSPLSEVLVCCERTDRCGSARTFNDGGHCLLLKLNNV